MNRPRLNPGAALLALLMAGLLALLAAAGIYVFQKHQWAQARLAELTPRYARLEGLLASQSEIGQAQTGAQALLARYVHPAAPDPGQTGNAAQQRVRDLFSAAGVQIVSSQVLPAKADKGFDTVPLSVRGEGDLVAVQAALVALAGQTPAIFLQGMAVQTVGAVRADAPPRLAAQFDLFVLQVHQP